MTIVEFLLARIAEDEADVQAGVYAGGIHDRYAAECKAKRQIIGPWSEGEGPGTIELIMQHPETDFGPHRALLVGVLRALAAIYSDHPDYRQEWRL